MEQIIDFAKKREENLLDNRDPLFGHCYGKFAFTSVDALFLQSLLPPHLMLAPQMYTPPGQHPLLLMFNDTHLETNPFLESIATKYNLQLILDYNEFVAMIPFVKFRNNNLNEEDEYCFLPVLYLDSLLAVLGGRIFWEFNKVMANFNTIPSDYSVRTEWLYQLIFSAQFNIAGDPVIGTSLPNFRDIIPMLELTVIEYGIYGYVSSTYKIEYNNVEITPITSVVLNTSSPYLPDNTLQSPSILENRLGAFIMNYNWSLSYIKIIRV